MNFLSSLQKPDDNKSTGFEKSTILQSNSPLWYHYRKGHITASYFHDVIYHKWKVYPMSCIKSIVQYSNYNLSTRPLQWGKEHEDDARLDYTEVMKTSHNNFSVKPSGLVIDPLHPFLAASPDGIIECQCCGRGLLEIKCSFKYRYMSSASDAALSDPQYCLKKDSEGEIIFNRSHKYYDQVQAQLAICQLPFCDFVCWTTQDLYCTRIVADEQYLSNNMPILEKYFCKYILPELLTQKLFSSISVPATSTLNNEEVFYICKKGEFGRMVACDSPKCDIGWFHFSCVNLRHAPAGKWYCPNCRK